MEQSAPVERDRVPRLWLVAGQIAFVATLVGLVLWMLLRPDDDALIHKADEWMNAGRYTYAAQAYLTVLNRDGHNRAAALGLARADFALHDYPIAMRLADSLLGQRDPDWHAAALLVGGMATGMGSGDSTLPLQAAADAATSPPMQRITRRRLAEARWGRQDYARAQRDYTALAEVRGSDAPTSHASQPAWDFVPFDVAADQQRVAYYTALLHASANLSGTIRVMQAITLPQLQARASGFAATVQRGRELQAQGSNEAAVFTIIGAAYLAVDECGLSRVALDTAAANMDKAAPIADLFAYRSVCRVRESDFVGAEQDLQHALQIDPHSSLAHHLYVRYYLSLPSLDRDKASREVAAAHAADPANPLIYLDEYDLDLRVGDYEAAETALTTYASMAQGQPSGAAAQAQLARFYLDSGYHLCGGNGYKAAMAAGQADEAEGLDAQGWAQHLCDKQPNSGKDALTRAVALDPGSARIHYHLGAVYASMGDTVQATDELQWAQDLDPDGDTAHRARELMVRLPQR